MRRLAILALAGALFAPIAARAATPPPPAPPPTTGFPTPGEAATALLAALLSGESWKIAAVIGPAAGGLLSTGDRAIDQEEIRNFIEAYADRHHIARTGADRAVLVIGAQDWPLPIPLRRGPAGWHFDATDAAQQILDRRIGRDEIGAIRGLLAIAAAQRSFLVAAGSHGYATRLVSTAGRRDGLYWPDSAKLPRSPLADVADADRARGYALTATEVPESYGGYRIRLLTAAGENAPGGAHSFLEGGRLERGFAYVAWPVHYGETGVMTFLLGPDGTVFQKDLGTGTDAAVAELRSYDPDLSWTLVKVKE